MTWSGEVPGGDTCACETAPVWAVRDPVLPATAGAERLLLLPLLLLPLLLRTMHYGCVYLIAVAR